MDMYLRVSRWLITYCPGDIGYKAFSFKPIKVACKAASGLARTNVILSMVDAAVKHFGPHLIVAPLFIGTLSGCGGRLIYGAVLFAVAPSACSHPELLYPSWYSHSAFLVSIVYTLAVHWMAVCSRDAAYGAIATFMVAHSAWEAVSDSHLDPSAPLFSLFHSVLRIPPPPAILHSSHDAPPAHSKPRESDTSAPASDSTDKQSPGTKTVSSSQPLGQDPSLANGGTDGEGKASRGEQKAFRRPRSKKA
ncbi:hypothetical protein CLOM_g18663 [Closterium sp. NIES-68]|nr:hypothetical protein CLOM_g18663 [Closterium sp. NIES-68]